MQLTIYIIFPYTVSLSQNNHIEFEEFLSILNQHSGSIFQIYIFMIRKPQKPTIFIYFLSKFIKKQTMILRILQDIFFVIANGRKWNFVMDFSLLPNYKLMEDLFGIVWVKLC